VPGGLERPDKLASYCTVPAAAVLRKAVSSCWAAGCCVRRGRFFGLLLSAATFCCRNLQGRYIFVNRGLFQSTITHIERELQRIGKWY